MFLLRRPSDDAIRELLDAQADLPFSYEAVGATETEPPAGWTVDHNRALLGRGDAIWRAARAAMERWAMFDLGWVAVHDPAAPLQAGALQAVIVRSLGLFVVSAARIVYRVDEPDRFGFAYGTLPGHVERGEERFSIQRDPETGEVWYDILAFSRPGHPLVWLGLPWARSQQRRFARDSMAAMQRAVGGG